MDLRNIIAISVFTFSSVSFAETEFPGNLIPANIAKEFSSGAISNGLPNNFPVPTLPSNASLYVLGSVDNIYSQRILLGTPLSGEEVKNLLKDSYALNGWVDLSRSSNTLELCHDTYGSLRFQMASAVGSENRIMVNRSLPFPNTAPSASCADQFAYLHGGPPTSPYDVFREAVPLLVLPPTSSTPAPTFPIGISSGSNATGTYHQAESDFSSDIPDYSLAELQEFFADQMTEEGWSLDGDFVGDKSASAVWFKTVSALGSNPLNQPVGVYIQMLLTAKITLVNLVGDSYGVSMVVSTGSRLPLPTGIRGVGSYLPLQP